MAPGVGNSRAPDDQVFSAGVAVTAKAARTVIVWHYGEGQSVKRVIRAPGFRGVPSWVGLPQLVALFAAANAAKAPGLALVGGAAGNPDVSNVWVLTDAATVWEIAPYLLGSGALRARKTVGEEAEHVVSSSEFAREAREPPLVAIGG